MWAILFIGLQFTLKKSGDPVLWKVYVVEGEELRHNWSGLVKPDNNMTCGEERERPGHLTAGHPEVKLIHHSLHRVSPSVNEVCSLLLSHCSRFICDWLALPKQEITLQVLFVRKSWYPKLKQQQMWVQLRITAVLPFKVKDHRVRRRCVRGLSGVCVQRAVRWCSWADTQAISDNDKRLAGLLPGQIPEGSAPPLFIYCSRFQQHTATRGGWVLTDGSMDIFGRGYSCGGRWELHLSVSHSVCVGVCVK